ncbi:MAG: hypothetical protein ACYC7E_14510 [Armatimonadota bacterium]
MKTILLQLCLATALLAGGVVFAQETAYRTTSPAHTCIFEAVRLYPSEIVARGGRVVDDPEATSAGKALEVTPHKMEGIYFGFAGKRPPVGECVLTFRIKVADATTASPALYLAAVDSDQRGFPLNQRLLTPVDFTRANQFQEFSLRFMRKPNQVILAGILWKGKAPNPSLVTVDTVTLARSTALLGIGQVRADRLWYRRNSDAVVTTTVCNHTDLPQQANLRCELVGDLAEARVVGTAPVTLQPHELKEVSCKFNVGKTEWGREARVSLMQDNRTVAAASDYITVADNPYKICHAYGGIFGVKDVAYAKGYRVPRFREGYVPVVEYFSWSPGMWADRSPEDEEWLSGQGNYRESKTGIRTFIELCHQTGIAVVTYAQSAFYGPKGFDWAREHPEWLAYDPRGRPQAWFDVEQVERQRDPHPTDPQWYGTFGGGSIWVANTDSIDHQAEELVKASQLFGFDGLRWDGHPLITTTPTMPDAGVPPAALDWQARPITDIKDPDGVSAANIARINGRILKTFPNYIFGYNWAPEYAGVVWPKLMPKLWKAIVPDGYILDEDLNTRGQDGSADRNNLWQTFAKRVVRSVDWVQPFGGYHYSGAITPGSHVFGCHMLAVLYAAGSRAAYIDPHHFSLDYSRFALRYGDMLFNNSLRRVKELEKVVVVNAKKPVWWKDYVYTQTIDARHSRTVVHLLNPPVKAYLDYNEHQPPPALEGIDVIGLAPSARATCARAWILSPDAEPFAVSVKPIWQSGQAILTLPKLRYWSVVIFEWSK